MQRQQTGRLPSGNEPAKPALAFRRVRRRTIGAVLSIPVARGGDSAGSPDAPASGHIDSAAVGHQPDDGDEGLAVMVVTTDQQVPQAVIDELVGSDGFLEGRAVSLG